MFSSINRVWGLASGLDVDKIVADLMKAERVPLDRLKQDRQLWVWRQEDYREVNRWLDDLRSTVYNLRFSSAFQARKAVSSNESVATATASANAPLATYDLNITAIATAASKTSLGKVSDATNGPIDASKPIWQQYTKFANWAWFEDPANVDPTTHQFSVTITTNITEATGDTANDVTKTFTFDADTDSLNTVLATIAADASLGISVFYDPLTDRVSIQTKKTGAGQSIKLSAGFLQDVLKLPTGESTGQDAALTINAVSVTSSTNTIAGNGITFQLWNTGTARITVDRDTDAVFNTIKDFVDKYNEILGKINDKLSEERFRDYPPLTDAQKEEMSDREIELWEEKARSGLLKHDSMISGIVSQMRRAVSDPVSGLPAAADRLAAIGITPGTFWVNGQLQLGGSYQDGGRLYLDEAKLRQVLSTNPDDVQKLFTQSGDTDATKGVAQRLYDILGQGINRLAGYAGKPDALYDQSYISNTIREIDERIERLEDRLQRIEDRYYRQFAVLERLVSQMNAQSAFLGFSSQQNQG